MAITIDTAIGIHIGVSGIRIVVVTMIDGDTGITSDVEASLRNKNKESPAERDASIRTV